MFDKTAKREVTTTMKFYVKCKLCLAIAEYRLMDMDLCQYHFIRLNNDILSKDGIEHISILERWLHE